MTTELSLDQGSPDIMRRKTELSLRGYFLWANRTVVISTNCPHLLDAAPDAGFLALDAPEMPRSDFQWELVGYPDFDLRTENSSCDTVRSGCSIYLAIGSRQWFAFDEETGEGAGFAAIPSSSQHRHSNLSLFFGAIAKALNEHFPGRPE